MMSPAKGYKGMGMNGWIARWYAKSTAKDMAAFRSLADRLATEMPTGSRILEIAPGPGYLAIELAKHGPYDITGLDISESFVEIATANAYKESVTIDFRQGDASAVPFAESTFDLIVCRAAFKNFSQPLEAINEMFRVLKPGGRAIVIDLHRDVSMEEIDRYIHERDFTWFDSWLIRLTFRFLLIPRAYTREQFAQMAARSRFGRAAIRDVEVGCEVAFAK